MGIGLYLSTPPMCGTQESERLDTHNISTVVGSTVYAYKKTTNSSMYLNMTKVTVCVRVCVSVLCMACRSRVPSSCQVWLRW